MRTLQPSTIWSRPVTSNLLANRRSILYTVAEKKRRECEHQTLCIAPEKETAGEKHKL